MPPPAVKNACRSERRALIAAMLAGLLSHPPHVPSDAMMIALYVAVLIGSVAKAGLDGTTLTEGNVTPAPSTAFFAVAAGWASDAWT